jgi:hypothetical protein
MLIRGFLGLSRSRRNGVVVAVATTAVARILVWSLPYRHIRRLVETGHRVARDAPDRTPERIAWEVSQASRIVPSATCLVQALAAEWLIRRTGAPVELRIGVANDRERGFHAHAWLESEGRVILGANGKDGFVPFEYSA